VTLNATISLVLTANALLAGSSSLAAVPLGQLLTAKLAGSSTLIPFVPLFTSALLSASSTLTGISVPATVSAVLAASGTLAATTSIALRASATLAGSGTLAISFTVNATLAGTSTLTAILALGQSTVATLAASSTLVGTPALGLTAKAALAASSTLTATTSLGLAANALLAGTASTLAATILGQGFTSTLAASSTLTANTRTGLAASATLAGSGALSVPLTNSAMVSLARLAASSSLFATATPVPFVPPPVAPRRSTGKIIYPQLLYPQPRTSTLPLPDSSPMTQVFQREVATLFVPVDPELTAIVRALQFTKPDTSTYEVEANLFYVADTFGLPHIIYTSDINEFDQFGFWQVEYEIPNGQPPQYTFYIFRGTP
jgi:hypothetical protein